MIHGELKQSKEHVVERRVDQLGDTNFGRQGRPEINGRDVLTPPETGFDHGGGYLTPHIQVIITHSRETASLGDETHVFEMRWLIVVLPGRKGHQIEQTVQEGEDKEQNEE
jgi:hypothetical protein